MEAGATPSRAFHARVTPPPARPSVSARKTLPSCLAVENLGGKRKRHTAPITCITADRPVGSEQGGARRPVIIVSNDGFNAAFPVVTVVPLTKREGKKRRVYPFEVVIPAKRAGHRVESIVMPYQIRTIDKARLLAPLGRVADASVRRAIEDRIIEHLGIAFDDPAGGDE